MQWISNNTRASGESYSILLIGVFWFRWKNNRKNKKKSINLSRELRSETTIEKRKPGKQNFENKTPKQSKTQIITGKIKTEQSEPN